VDLVTGRSEIPGSYVQNTCLSSPKPPLKFQLVLFPRPVDVTVCYSVTFILLILTITYAR